VYVALSCGWTLLFADTGTKLEMGLSSFKSLVVCVFIIKPDNNINADCFMNYELFTYKRISMKLLVLL